MSERSGGWSVCPIPISRFPRVVMAHGGGGRIMARLISDMFRAAFDNAELNQGHDGAVLDVSAHAASGGRIAMTTDSYVVRPLRFPGSTIGAMAVNGTANDLAMCCAEPRWLTTGFILEEGLAMETLWEMVCSMADAAALAGVHIVTGDTKVVEHGRGDGMYINTAGVGLVRPGADCRAQRVEPGDAVILSGDVGRHGMAVMTVREGLEFEAEITSDCAPVWPTVRAMLEAGIDIHCLRDATRGGLASAVVEIAEASGTSIHLTESAIEVQPQVAAACELLGFDPIYVANEGRFVAFVPSRQADAALEAMADTLPGARPSVIGRVEASDPGMVALRSVIGGERIVDMLSGEQLPRIC